MINKPAKSIYTHQMSHCAPPAISRTRKPTPDPMYPTFAVGETDSNNETTRVAAVTEPKSDQHKLMEMIRRILSNTERPNPKPEIPDILERLQQLLRESVPNTLEQTLRPLFDGQRQRQRQPPRLRQQRRDWTELTCFHVDSWDIGRCVALTLTEHCRSHNQDGERRRGWVGLR